MKIIPDRGDFGSGGPAVLSDTMVTLMGGGRVNEGALRAALERAPGLAAADGGADAALARGLTPDAVIGDMDSLGRAGIGLDASRFLRVDEQETTDFDKALRHIRAPAVLAVGFTGRRLDHELAVYNALVRGAGPPCVVLGDTDLAFAAPPRIDLALPADTRLSLFPMASVSGTSRGLRWPIDGIVFAPDGRIGTSNRTTGPVSLTFEAPGMLVILPRAGLDAALAGLGVTERLPLAPQSGTV